jgi:uncharacterized protein (UPF0276 family)
VSALAALGIGLPYLHQLPPEIYRGGVVDFVEVTPEVLCRERRSGALDLLPDRLAQAQQTCGALPIVAHGVELSIGSAHGCNSAYLEMLDRFQKLWPFQWHSEHLGFQTIGEDAHTLNTGVPLPMPATVEAAQLVAGRSAAIRRRYGVPFLLENAAHYLPDLPSDPEIGDDVGLMNAICDQGGCLQLLDLHNVWCNAVNHRLDPYAAIDRMRLDRVGEIHVAGGSWQEGFWMDAHDSRVPEPVWELLEYTLPRTPNVGGVVFEVLEVHVPRLGPNLIAAEVLRAREIWKRCAPREGGACP